jgi:hypothetical protein
MRKFVAAILAAFSFAAHAEPYSSVGIYFDGDSTTVGYTVMGGTPSCNDGSTATGCTAHDYGHNVSGGAGYIQAYNEPAEVQIQMVKAFGSSVSVENHGIGGMTVLDSINGTGGYDCSTSAPNPSNTCGPLGQRLQASHALVVVGHFLTNDQYRMTSSQYQAYVSTWISTVQGLRNADGNPMIPVWEESAPICRLDAPNVAPYLAAGRAAASAAGVLLVGNHDWVYQNQDWIPHLNDCVHPDAYLYIVMGDQLATSLGRTVQVLLGR